MVRVYKLSRVPSTAEYIAGLTAIQPRVSETQLHQTDFVKLIQPHCQMTTARVVEAEVVLCVEDTTYLDYSGLSSLTLLSDQRVL